MPPTTRSININDTQQQYWDSKFLYHIILYHIIFYHLIIPSLFHRFQAYLHFTSDELFFLVFEMQCDQVSYKYLSLYTEPETAVFY